MKFKYSLVIPCHNERENIPRLVKNINDHLKGIIYEIIIIDDYSTDNTYEVLKEYIDSKEIKYIKLSKNYGQSIATQVGIENADYDNIITIDGDGQNNPYSAKSLIEIFEKEKLDIIFGNRKHRKDAKPRLLLSLIANFMLRKLFKINIKDFGCSLRVFKKKLLKTNPLYSEQHRILPLILTYNKKINYRQVDVLHNERKFGKSHYGNKRIIKLFFDSLIFICLEKFENKPIYFFGVFFLSFLVLAFGTFIIMIYIKFFLGRSFILTPLPVLASLFLSMSFTSLMLGFVCEIFIKNQKKDISQNLSSYEIDFKNF